MGQIIETRGNTQDLALIAKALTAKRDGISMADRGNITQTGKFRRAGTLHYVVTGEIAEDYDQEKFFGVKLDDLLNMLIAAVPGIVENHMRRACAILTEIHRARVEERRLRPAEYYDPDTGLVTVEVSDIKAATERVEKLRDKAAEITKEFAKSIKVTRTQAGAVTIKEAKFQVEKITRVAGDASLEQEDE